MSVPQEVKYALPPLGVGPPPPEQEAKWGFAEARADILREVADRQQPAAIPPPILMDGPVMPLAAPALPRRPTRPRRSKAAAQAAAKPHVPTPPGPVFDRLALYRPQAEPVAPYTMPGGGKVFPHPLSGAERKYVNVQVALHLDRLYAGREAPQTDEERALRGFERMTDAEILADIWTAVVGAKVGPEPGAERVFKDEDAEAFYRNEGWDEAAQAIAAQARSYSAGTGPVEALREALCPFFAATRTLLDWCGEQLDTAYSDGTDPPSPVQEVRKTLRSCAGSLQPLTLPKSWGADDVAAAAARLGKGR